MSVNTLYRKHRPYNFSKIIGQENIVRTLSNSITNEKTAHAYLFYGPRGTGKTTTARVFAKTLNCLSRKGILTCEKCRNCLEFIKNKFIDLLEIDAASNNSVDDVRYMKEQIYLQPMVSSYKIYIIDEVHMLSKGAFNALLKMLEEPPSHIIFILATTEYYKVPITIRSRCQEYEFKTISTELIEKELTKILKKEKIKFSQQAIKLIAEYSEGSMRDALTNLEENIIFSNNNINLMDVYQNLGIVDKKELNKFLELIFIRKVEEIILFIQKLKEKNIYFEKFVHQILHLLTSILEFKITGDDIFLKPSLNSIQGVIVQQDVNSINKLISLFIKLIEDKNSSNSWMYLELSLCGLLIDDVVPKKTIIKKQKENIAQKKPILDLDNYFARELNKFKTLNKKNSIIEAEYLLSIAYFAWSNLKDRADDIKKLNQKINDYWNECKNSKKWPSELISFYKSKIFAFYKGSVIFLATSFKQRDWMYQQLLNKKNNFSLFEKIVIKPKIKNIFIIVFSEENKIELVKKFENWKNNQKKPISRFYQEKYWDYIQKISQYFQTETKNFIIGQTIFSNYKLAS